MSPKKLEITWTRKIWRYITTEFWIADFEYPIRYLHLSSFKTPKSIFRREKWQSILWSGSYLRTSLENWGRVKYLSIWIIEFLSPSPPNGSRNDFEWAKLKRTCKNFLGRRFWIFILNSTQIRALRNQISWLKWQIYNFFDTSIHARRSKALCSRITISCGKALENDPSFARIFEPNAVEGSLWSSWPLCRFISIYKCTIRSSVRFTFINTNVGLMLKWEMKLNRSFSFEFLVQ